MHSFMGRFYALFEVAAVDRISTGRADPPCGCQVTAPGIGVTEDTQSREIRLRVVVDGSPWELPPQDGIRVRLLLARGKLARAGRAAARCARRLGPWLLTSVVFVPLAWAALWGVSHFTSLSPEDAPFEVTSIVLSSIGLLVIKETVDGERERHRTLRLQYWFAREFRANVASALEDLSSACGEGALDREDAAAALGDIRRLVSDSHHTAVRQGFVEMAPDGGDYPRLENVQSLLTTIRALVDQDNCEAAERAVDELAEELHTVAAALERPWHLPEDERRDRAVARLLEDRGRRAG